MSTVSFRFCRKGRFFIFTAGKQIYLIFKQTVFFCPFRHRWHGFCNIKLVCLCSPAKAFASGLLLRFLKPAANSRKLCGPSTALPHPAAMQWTDKKQNKAFGRKNNFAVPFQRNFFSRRGAMPAADFSAICEPEPICREITNDGFFFPNFTASVRTAGNPFGNPFGKRFVALSPSFDARRAVFSAHAYPCNSRDTETRQRRRYESLRLHRSLCRSSLPFR